MEERIRVALVRVAPVVTYAFSAPQPTADSTLNVDVIIQKDAQSFYEMSVIILQCASDVLVLLGYDEGVWSQDALGLMRERVRDGMGLLFVAGTDGIDWWQDPSGIDELLPVERRRSPFVEGLTSLRRSSQGTGHPIVRSNLRTTG